MLKMRRWGDVTTLLSLCYLLYFMGISSFKWESTEAFQSRYSERLCNIVTARITKSAKEPFCCWNETKDTVKRQSNNGADGSYLFINHYSMVKSLPTQVQKLNKSGLIPRNALNFHEKQCVYLMYVDPAGTLFFTVLKWISTRSLFWLVVRILETFWSWQLWRHQFLTDS